MQPSERQQDIIDLWTTTDKNILINAVAGSGKTSTLLMLLEKCDKRTLFVAFNKAIQEDIQQKIDQRNLQQGKAMTLHSLGLLAIKNSGRKIVINNNKNWNIIKILQINKRALFKTIQENERQKVIFSLIDLNDTSRILLTEDFNTISDFLIGMGKTLSDSNALPELWEEFIKLRNTTYQENVIEIDFNDMIFLPIYFDLEIPVYPGYLMIDECQDLNLAQHTLIDKIINQETLSKWIAVGDRNQAIYGFSGALTSSFDEFMEKGNVQEMPLDICYRCPIEVVEKANKVYNIMFSAPNAEQGIVQNIYEASEIKENSMVICRNTSPLFDLYFYLLSQDKTCYINGSDIMANLIKFLKPYIKDTVHSAFVEMNYVMADMEMKLDKEEDKIKYFIFKENVSIFNKITKHMCDPLDKISDFLLRLKELFENKENAITLCTIHKSKGLENDVVYIVNESETIPSKFAKTGEQLKQEQNLKYVARTRAKKELYFLNVKTKGTENMDLELEEVEQN